MHVSSEQVLANAIVYLLDGGEEEAANLLLSCNMQIHDSQDSRNLGYRTYVDVVLGKEKGDAYETEISGRRKLFEILSDDNNRLTKVVFEAIRLSLFSLDSYYDCDNSHAFTRPTVYVKLPNENFQANVLKIVQSAGVETPSIGGIQLRRGGKSQVLRPIPIFPLGQFERNDKLCFVMMPFAPQFQAVYGGIKHAVEGQGMICQRADDIMQPGDIISQVWRSLIEARIVIADLSNGNGNVFYELGLAHVIGHQAILLTQDIKTVPFDLQQMRKIEYTLTDSGITKLTSDLGLAIQQVLPLTAAP